MRPTLPPLTHVEGHARTLKVPNFRNAVLAHIAHAPHALRQEKPHSTFALSPSTNAEHPAMSGIFKAHQLIGDIFAPGGSAVPCSATISIPLQLSRMVVA